MQYVKPFRQGKPNSSLDGANIPWIVSGYNFHIMNTLLEYEADPI